jgi:hypothetical protein
MHVPASRVTVATFVLLMALSAALPAPAQAAAPLPARVAFDEPLGAPSTIIATIDKLPRDTRVPVMARVEVDRKTIEPNADGVYHFEALDARLAQYRDKQIPVWLTLDGLRAFEAVAAASAAGAGSSAAAPAATSSAPAAAGTASSAAAGKLPITKTAGAAGVRAAGQAPVGAAAQVQHEAWGRFVRALARHLANRVAIVELSLPDVASLDDAAVELVAFDVKRAAIELHGADSNVIVALSAQRFADASRLEAFYARDLAAYLDAVVTTDAGVSPARALLDRLDPTAQVFERGAMLDGDAAAAWRTFITTELCRLGTASALAGYRASPSILQTLLRQAPAYGDLLGGELARIDDATSQLTIEPGASKHLLVYETAKFGTYLIYAGAGAAPGTGATTRISLKIASDAKPTVRDPLTGAKRDVTGFTRDTAAQRSTFSVPLAASVSASPATADAPLIIDFNDSLGSVITERSEVKGKTTLSVAEIIARHQQVQAAQDAQVRTYTVASRMEQHFRPAISDPGYDVVTENRFFVEDEQVEWEELSFSVNGSTWKENRPPFPILQPEKVLSVPLKLRMTADYRYRLAGTETVDGHDCYVINFDPSHADQSLYRGVVWIDMTSFVRRKLQAVQTKLSAPVVSNEETHHFEQVATLDGRAITLPTRITSHQIVLIAGRNLLVDKETAFSNYDLNPSAFSSRRQSARASNRIMYRDTDHGIRYLEKQGEERVVREKDTTSAKAIAMGTTIDPSFDFPLPIFGINYLDFNFRGPDSQLALLFAGVLGLGNIQRPKLFGNSHLDGSVDFFAIAVPGSDRIYGIGGERKDERLLTWPMFANANIGYQVDSFQKLSAQYQFHFDAFLRDGRTTPEDYTAPSSTSTHGVGASYEYKRGGYSVIANGTWFGRAHWKPWGPAGNLQQTPRTYDKYSLNISKDWYFGLFQKVHVNGAWFGGDRLDRFSQYQFGMFDDTKIHGVPSSGVRYGELSMARGSYSFNIFEQYRFDLFLEQAWARDRAAATDWDRITGVGAAVNVKGPWTTILKVDVGKSFLPERYRANGSTVIQILVLKPLGKG